MSKVVLSNTAVSVTIDTLGAEMVSMRDAQGVERLWEGNPAVWKSHAPVLFPVCGGLKEDRYTLDGKSYPMAKHGFAKTREFLVETQTADGVTMVLRADEETRKGFPFAFTLRVRYALEGSRVCVEYIVSNEGDRTMYFSMGAHEGYACPEGIEAYEIVFDETENARSYVLHGNLLGEETRDTLRDTRVFPLKYEDFAVDALVFLDVRSRGVTLRSRAHGRTIRVDFPGFAYFLLWTKPNAPYICIEPWCGIQDFEGTSFDLTQKRGILSLPAGETLTRTHTITLFSSEGVSV
ncbi:MAG: aldose 1-epimerase family protein [Clostridia bacterium]